MQQNKPTVIGITGITGSGTSTVAKIIAGETGLVINADQLVHDLMKKNNPAFAKIVAAFGESILSTDPETLGEINRRALGAIVFSNPAEMARLENILHPLVINHINEIIESSSRSIIVIDAPMLVESGLNTICHKVYLVVADDLTRINRIVKRDGITPAAAEARLRSRKGDNFLIPHADIIINNNGTLQDLSHELKQI